MRTLIVAIVAALFFTQGAAMGQTLPPGPGADLVAQACGTCHGLDRALEGPHYADGWDALVKDMNAYEGATITDAERIQIVAYLAANFAPPPDVTTAPGAPPDWTAVASALNKTGAVGADGVYRVDLPRTDLTVKLDGIRLDPSFALGSWVAFKPTGNQTTMVMGDLVLTENEVEPVAKFLLDNGVEITALHNHLLHARPATFHMHVEGQGDPMKLAWTINAALARGSKTPFVTRAAPATPPPIDLDTAAIDKALGAKGNNAGGVYQVSIARTPAPTVQGVALGPSMGVSEAINFQPLGGGKAAITGDFMLTANEVNPVLRALRENGVEVTALHSHMLEEEPRLFFMHFWAHGGLPKLLTGLHAALAQLALAK